MYSANSSFMINIFLETEFNFSGEVYKKASKVFRNRVFSWSQLNFYVQLYKLQDSRLW